MVKGYPLVPQVIPKTLRSRAGGQAVQTAKTVYQAVQTDKTVYRLT